MLEVLVYIGCGLVGFLAYMLRNFAWEEFQAWPRKQVLKHTATDPDLRDEMLATLAAETTFSQYRYVLRNLGGQYDECCVSSYCRPERQAVSAAERDRETGSPIWPDLFSPDDEVFSFFTQVLLPVAFTASQKSYSGAPIDDEYRAVMEEALRKVRIAATNHKFESRFAEWIAWRARQVAPPL